MDEEEQDVYVAQLHEVFESCDRDAKGFLDRNELIDLCKKLQLDDQVPHLLKQLLGNEETDGQVTFDDFKEGFVAVLSQAIDALSSSEDEDVTSDNTEPPKLVVNDKRYGRRSRPDVSASEDLYSADEESLVESRPVSQLSDSNVSPSPQARQSPVRGQTERVEKTKNRRRISSRKSSLRNSIRRHNSKILRSRDESQDDLLEANEHFSPSPGPDSRENGVESPTEEQQLRAIWNEVNVGATGYLDLHELSVVCDHIGMDSMNEQELSLLFEELDEDGDGKVSFDEFLHGLFAAKDSQDAVDGEEWIESVHSEPYQSTPYAQPASPSSRIKAPQSGTSLDDTFLTRTATTSSFDLLAILDPEHTGFAKVEDIRDLWEAQGLEDALPLLEHVDVDADNRVSLHQLTNLLESIIHEQSDGFSQAVVSIYKHEMQYLRSQVETAATERDAFKEHAAKLGEEKEMLIRESEESSRQVERLHEGKFKEQESKWMEKFQNLQTTMEQERDKDLLNASQHRSQLEDTLHSTKSEEQRLRIKLTEAEEEILRLEKSLADTQEKLGDSENKRERLEKELESMADMSSRLAEVEKQQLLKQQQNRNATKSVRELEKINRELRDENDELRLQNEALTAQVNSSVKRRSSHRKRQPGDKGVSRHGSVVSDYIKPTVIRRNKEGVTSSDESDHELANANGTVPSIRVSGDGGSNEDADDDLEKEEQRKTIEKLQGDLLDKEEEIKKHLSKMAEQESSISELLESAKNQESLAGKQSLSIEEYQTQVRELNATVKDQEVELNKLHNEVDSLRSSMNSEGTEKQARYDSEVSKLTAQFTGEMEELQAQFNTEREQLEKEHQAKLDDLERSLESEKESLKLELETCFMQEKELLISEYEREKSDADDEHRKEKEMLEEMYNGELAKEKQQSEEEKFKLREKLHVLEDEKSQTELKLINEKAELDQQYRIEKMEWELQNSSKTAEFQKNEREWSTLKSELEKSHQQHVAELEAKFKKEKAALEEEFSNEIWELKQAHSKEIAGLKQTFEVQKVETERAFALEKSEMKESFTREKHEAEQRFNREKAELREMLDRENSQNLAVQEAELKKAFLKEKSALEKKYDEEKVRLEEEFQETAAMNEINFQKWKAEMEERFTEEKAKVLQNSAREKGDVEQKYKDEINELRQAFTEGEAGLKGQLKDDFFRLLAKHKAELEDSYNKEKQQLEASYSREKADLLLSGEVGIKEIEESYSREKGDLEESYKMKIKQLQENFAREKQELEKEQEKDKLRFRSSLELEFASKHKSETEVLQQKVKQLQEEINFMREQKKEYETRIQTLELRTMTRSDKEAIELKVAREKIVELEEKLDALNKEKVMILENSIQQISEHKIKLDELEKEKTTLEDKAVDRERQLMEAERAKTELLSAEMKLEEVANRKAVLEKLLKEKNSKANQLQEEVYTLKEKLASAEADHRRELESARQKATLSSSELSSLRSRHQREVEDMKEQLHRANMASDRDQALREKVFNEAKAEVLALNKKLEEKTKRLRELENASHLWEGRIRELEKQKQELIIKVTQTRGALDEHVSRLTQQVKQTEIRATRSDTLVQELYIENAKLTKSLQQTEANERRAEKSNRQLQEQKRALQRVISKLCGANAIA